MKKNLLCTFGMTLLAGVSAPEARGAPLPMLPHTVHASVLEHRVGKDQAECAVRVVAAVADKERVDLFDIVVGADAASGRGTLSAHKSTGQLERFHAHGQRALTRSLPAPADAWIGLADKDAVPLAMDQAVPDDKDGSVFGATSLVRTLLTLAALAQGETVLVGLRYRADQDPVHLRFAASLPAAERSKVMSCLRAAVALVRKQS